MPVPPQTEASCLLASGTLYRRRIGLRQASGHADLVFAGFKSGGFSVYFGDAPIYHFDLEGRWQRAFVEPTHYLKGLDTRVHAVDRVREGSNLVLRRRALDDQEARALDLQVQGIALGLLGELDRGRLRFEAPPPEKALPLQAEELRDILERIAAWDEAAWARHRTGYESTYGPLPFLPPECQNALVLQATIGHAGGRAFAHGTAEPHSVRTGEEFSAHVEQVAALLGRRIHQSRVVFLAGSDALRCPPDAVTGWLEVIQDRLPIGAKPKGVAGAGDAPGLEGVHVFLDEFSSHLPDLELLRTWRDLQLTHVSLGVESGSPAVRRSFGRTWDEGELRRFVASLHEAAIRVSVLVLVGAGGTALADEHVRETARLLESLDLRRGERVFLLDERELRSEDAPVADEPLRGEAWLEQQAALKQALAGLKERGVQILPYSLEKQWG